MKVIILYIKSMFPYMLITIPIYVLFRLLFFKKRKINWYREMALLLFVLFIVGLASQALVSNNRVHSTNLIPFIVLKDTYNEVFINGNINYFLINFIGNIIIFMPLGFFIPLLWNIENKKVILIGFLSSLFIEVVQLFLARGTDIDDLILNTIGSSLGLLIFNILNRKNKLDIFRRR